MKIIAENRKDELTFFYSERFFPWTEMDLS